MLPKILVSIMFILKSSIVIHVVIFSFIMVLNYLFNTIPKAIYLDFMKDMHKKIKKKDFIYLIGKKEKDKVLQIE